MSPAVVPTPRFCPQCGAPLEERLVGHHRRPACPRCDFVHYDDPKLAVGVVAEWEGQIVLARRNHEPRAGQWSFPSGYVDAGEVPEEAAVREAQEETGLEVRIEGLLGVYAARGERTVYVAYAGHVVGGRLRPGDECIEVGAFPYEGLPRLAFPHDADILRAWRAWRRAHRARP